MLRVDNIHAFFGPGGNSQDFILEGYKSTIDAPRYVSSLGLNAYEYEAGNGLSASRETLRLIGSEARKYGVKLSYHTPYFISLSGVVEEKRLKSINYIEESIDAASLLGAETIVVHSGSCAKITREEAMYLAGDTLYKLVDRVDLKGIKVGLETMGKINQLGTLDEVIKLCKISDSFVPVVDFGHLNSRELGGVFNNQDDYKRVFDIIGSELGDDIARNLHCHFSKIEWSSGGEKRHLTFDDSVYGPDFEPLVEVIARENLSPTVICESAGTQSRDSKAMMDYYLTLKDKVVL